MLRHCGPSLERVGRRPRARRILARSRIPGLPGSRAFIGKQELPNWVCVKGPYSASLRSHFAFRFPPKGSAKSRNRRIRDRDFAREMLRSPRDIWTCGMLFRAFRGHREHFAEGVHFATARICIASRNSGNCEAADRSPRRLRNRARPPPPASGGGALVPPLLPSLRRGAKSVISHVTV
jgi:hypothetical protein